MRPVNKSKRTQIFDPYDTAKDDLESELGEYCSYCERTGDLEVEHIYAKSKYKHLETNWDNFLLACKNCNSTKGDKDISVLNPFMPHEHNLLCFIEIIVGGRIEIKSHLSTAEHKRTEAFIDLIGLDRHPGHPNYSKKDRRWKKREKCYELAQNNLKKYELGGTNKENIIELAMYSGFFSVWFTVFKDHKEIREALIFGITHRTPLMPFPNTDIDSFDVVNNYDTVPRPAK